MQKGEAMGLLRSSWTAALLCALFPASYATVAHADFRVCNKTASRVGIAIGYKAPRDWTTRPLESTNQQWLRASASDSPSARAAAT